MARKLGKSKGYEAALLHNGATQGDEQMAKVPGLSRRGGVWQFRVRVPEKLKSAIGKGEIVKSLGNVSFAEAARLARIERHDVDRQFAEAEVHLRSQPVEELSESELHHLARAFFYRLEKDAQKVPFDPDQRAELAAIAASDLAAIGDWDDQQVVQRVALEFADWAKVRVKMGSRAFFDLCAAVQAAHIEHYGREFDRMSGRPERHGEARFRDIDKDRPPKPRVTLAEAVKRYVEDPKRADNAPKTLAAYKFRFAAWVDLLGANRDVVDIDREDIRDALDVLMRLPANAVRKYRNVSLRKIAVASVPEGQRKLGAKSIKLYLEILSSLFRYLIIEQKISTNPVLGINGPKLPREKPRRPWTLEELNLFFKTAPFNRPWSGGNERSWLFWMPLISLFSGSREGELAALKQEDVFKDGEDWFINLEYNEDRSLKNEHSIRAFPVHPTIIRLGFIDFVRTQPSGGLLFSDIRSSKLGPAHWTGQLIVRHVRKVFSDPKVVFHSLRHNFRDAAREANVPLEVVSQIGGWTEGRQSAMSSYGLGYSRKSLAAWMAKIEYAGLKLDHLMPTEAPLLRVRYRQRPRSA